MPIKSVTYQIQQQVNAELNVKLSRSQVYELLAASCSYSTYASLCADGFIVINGKPSSDLNSIRMRCRLMDISAEAQVSSILSQSLLHKKFCLIPLPTLLDAMTQPEEFSMIQWRDDKVTDDVFTSPYIGIRKSIFDGNECFHPEVENQLNSLAMNGNRGANFILAYQMGIPDPEFDSAPYGKYLYIQWKQGVLLSESNSRSAIEFECWLDQKCKLINHLRVASEGNDLYSMMAKEGLWALDVDDVLSYIQ